MYLGRNLDWSFDYGQQVRVMPRGFHIPYSFIDDATAAHAVIGMCIDYKNYPMFFDCGNDAGIAVAGLNFPGYAEYAEGPVDGKTNIAAYEFPLWVAATFSTVDEVEAALRDTVIAAEGEELRGHEFHFSSAEPLAEIPNAFLFTKNRTGDTYTAGYATENILGSYLHLHFAGFPKAAERFVEKCAGYKKSK